MPPVTNGRRLRGALLRLVRNRRLATLLGLVVMAPGLWLFFADLPWESGATDGFALLAVATGVALVWTGLTGRQADWVDPNP